jgi:hypothetical protein
MNGRVQGPALSPTLSHLADRYGRTGVKKVNRMVLEDGQRREAVAFLGKPCAAPRSIGKLSSDKWH